MKQLQQEALLELRDKIGMNRTEFAKYLNIPYRTIEDWEKGHRKMPDYVLRLIEYKVAVDYRDKFKETKAD